MNLSVTKVDSDVQCTLSCIYYMKAYYDSGVLQNYVISWIKDFTFLGGGNWQRLCDIGLRITHAIYMLLFLSDNAAVYGQP